jgi:hypothetical protein
MSLNKLLISVLFAACTSSAASSIDCPRTLSVNGAIRPLEGASMFEGRPENLVDLMPDLQNSEWDIALNQKHARQRGESMYLVCRYQGIKDTVTLEVPGGSTLCKVEGTSKGLAAWCKPPLRRTTKTN